MDLFLRLKTGDAQTFCLVTHMPGPCGTLDVGARHPTILLRYTCNQTIQISKDTTFCSSMHYCSVSTPFLKETQFLLCQSFLLYFINYLLISRVYVVLRYVPFVSSPDERLRSVLFRRLEPIFYGVFVPCWAGRITGPLHM